MTRGWNTKEEWDKSVQFEEPQIEDKIGEQCTGTTRNGERCKRGALPGTTVCARHGGKAPQVVKAARAKVATEFVDNKLSTELERVRRATDEDIIDRDPVQVLKRLMRRSEGMILWLQQEIDKIHDKEDETKPEQSALLRTVEVEQVQGVGQGGAVDTRRNLIRQEANVLLREYRSERDHLMKLAKLGLDANLRALEIEQAQEQARLIEKAIVNVLERLGLADQQKEQIIVAIAHELNNE